MLKDLIIEFKWSKRNLLFCKMSFFDFLLVFKSLKKKKKKNKRLIKKYLFNVF